MINQNFVKTLLVLGVLLGFWQVSFAFQPADIKVWINQEPKELNNTIHSFLLLPGDKIILGVSKSDAIISYRIHKKLKLLPEQKSQRWQIDLPEKAGVYPLKLKRDGQLVQLNFIVQVPYHQISKHKLNGYRIGVYPKVRQIKTKVYHHPKGFIEVTEKNKKIKISPHFQLEQFLCKQSGSYPKYIVIEEALLMKLESLVNVVQDEGYTCTTFAVLSGYRTPYYNQTLGNVAYSAHLYGKAADIYIDEDKNGLMDDLNRDGSLDYRDAKILYRLVNRLEKSQEHKELVGGLGLYGRTSTHSPFVHVDVRGYQARWGNVKYNKHVNNQLIKKKSDTN